MFARAASTMASLPCSRVSSLSLSLSLSIYQSLSIFLFSIRFFDRMSLSCYRDSLTLFLENFMASLLLFHEYLSRSGCVVLHAFDSYFVVISCKINHYIGIDAIAISETFDILHALDSTLWHW
eukprot:TRINITY_DN27225_c1_g1_i4.p1 TRINITY_DN27225_c1_g1~~TRINITY_DN27225_c1_g1_i4.p1  ORF type:complete len:123 (-),score=14.36 TRINITY_DN27225_c1_g1_i4:74-442(-)